MATSRKEAEKSGCSWVRRGVGVKQGGNDFVEESSGIDSE